MPKPARRHAARPAGRTATDILGGMFALLALLALVVALPVALAWLTPKLVTLPDHVPNLRELRAALLRRDDGQHLALAVIAGIGWIGWLWFAVSVLVETVAQVRGLPAPRVRGFGGGQRLAASLVTSAAVLLSSGSPALAVAGNAAPMPAAPWFQVPVAALATAPANYPAPPPSGPGQLTVSVPAPMAAPAAEQVVAPAADPVPAPAAVAQPANDDTAATQAVPTAAAGGPTAAPEHPVYEVVRGDNLWNIARQHLGDPTRWPEIWAMNKGHTQPTGRSFSNPNLIFPGEKMTVPDDAKGIPGWPPPAAQSPAPAPPAPPAPPSTTPTHPPTHPPSASPSASPKHTQSPTHAPSHPASPSPTHQQGQVPPPGAPVPGSPSAKPSAAHPTSPAKHPSPPPSAHPKPTGQASVPAGQVPPGGSVADQHTPPPATTHSAAGERGNNAVPIAEIGALLAAGLLTLLVAVRLGRRRRRVDDTWAFPPPADEADEELDFFSDRLRRTAVPVPRDLISYALRALGGTLRAERRTPPQVVAARRDRGTLQLWVADSSPAAAPFSDTDEPHLWMFDFDDAERIDLPTAARMPSPYPFLVVVGFDERRNDVMLDLETAGVLWLVPDERDVDSAWVRPILAALTCELATSNHADQMRVTCVSFGNDLVDAFEDDRVTYAGDFDEALDDLETVVAGGAAWSSYGAHRSQEEELGERPQVLLSALPPSSQQWDRLKALTRTAPDLRIAMVALAGPEVDPEQLPGWRMHLAPDGSARVEPVGLALAQVQRLTEETRRRLVHVLSSARGPAYDESDLAGPPEPPATGPSREPPAAGPEPEPPAKGPATGPGEERPAAPPAAGQSDGEEEAPWRGPSRGGSAGWTGPEPE